MQPRNFNLLQYIFADYLHHDGVACIIHVKYLCLPLGDVIWATYPEVLGTSSLSTAASSEEYQEAALAQREDVSGVQQNGGC